MTDEDAIKAIIVRQFGSLNWAPGKSADWGAFSADFLSDAPLYPAARPARSQRVDAFLERMKGLAGTSLQSFAERPLGATIHVFGNVAVAVAACEFTENGRDVSRGVEMMLLVKDGDAWRIAAQAWDKASDARPIPEGLGTI